MDHDSPALSAPDAALSRAWGAAAVAGPRVDESIGMLLYQAGHICWVDSIQKPAGEQGATTQGAAAAMLMVGPGFTVASRGLYLLWKAGRADALDAVSSVLECDVCQPHEVEAAMQRALASVGVEFEIVY